MADGRSWVSRWSVASWRCVVLCACLASVNLRCTTNHDQLARRPAGGGAGGTGSGGSTSSTQATAASNVTSSTTTTGGTTVPYIPDGSDVLTLVNGEVDAGRIWFCLGTADEGGSVVFSQAPVPSRGLRYGGHWTLSEASTPDFAEQDLVVVVLAGELPSDTDCDAAFEQAYWPARSMVPPILGTAGASGAGGAGGAGGDEPPPLRAMQLPTIVRGSLTLGRHYVMAVTGCMGGPGVFDSGLHCGATHTPQTPSLRPLLAPVSRQVATGKLALQFMNASAASAEVDFHSSPSADGGGLSVFMSFDLAYGALAPRDPNVSYSMQDLGISEGALLEVYQDSVKRFGLTWLQAAPDAVLDDGGSYLIVLLGPSLGSESEPGFNGTTVTIVDTGVGRDE